MADTNIHTTSRATHEVDGALGRVERLEEQKGRDAEGSHGSTVERGRGYGRQRGYGSEREETAVRREPGRRE